MRVLVLEASTSSAKAMVYDSKQGIIALNTKAYGEDVGNCAVQDSIKVYDTLIEVGRTVANGHDIKAVALGGIWHSLIVFDKDMNPVTPTHTWASVDAAAMAEELRKDKIFMDRMYTGTGCIPHAIYPLYRLMYFKQQGMDLTDKYFCGQGDYNFYRMTGHKLSSASMMSGTGFMSLDGLEYYQESMELCGITKQQMPQISDYSDAKPLEKSAALALGIKSGIPVIPAMPDGALNQIGSRALKKGVMTLSVGTSAAIRMVSDDARVSENYATWCYYNTDNYLCGCAISGAANCVDWFINDVLRGRLNYNELEALIDDKSNAPYFLPFLFGERNPGWRDGVKGGFYGVDGKSDCGSMYYAVLEGVLFNLYQCYLELIKTVSEPDTIIVSGGICNSQLWLNMLADIFGKDMILQNQEQASMMGGALLALRHIDEISDVEAYEAPVGDVIKTDINMHNHYNRRFKKYLYYYNQL